LAYNRTYKHIFKTTLELETLNLVYSFLLESRVCALIMFLKMGVA